MDDNHILPECYIDTNLIEALVPPDRYGYNHQKGCPAVAKKMKEKFADSFAVGVMDKDKRTVSYLQEFDLLASDGVLYVYKHRARQHYILLIAPAVEVFILHAAEELGIDLDDYGVPKDLDELKRETKRVDASCNQKYKRLFKALRAATECRRLSEVIGYLKGEKFHAQADTLKRLLRS